MSEQTLFDVLEPKEWREAPQALFDSWSAQRQLAYCAARDTDAAEREQDEDWRRFYQQRAAAYRSDIT